MKSWVLLVAGLGWPFLLTGGALLASHWDEGEAYILFFISGAGAPAVVFGLLACLPARWSDQMRHMVAVLGGMLATFVSVSLAWIAFLLIATQFD